MSGTDLRAAFATLIHKQMQRNQRIWVITGDLGFVLWDRVRADFPDRFVNAGAAEQAMTGVAVGLALQHKIPVVYSITPFLLYRPFETIRNYIHHEKIPVKLIGSGADTDYENEGISHWALEDQKVMRIFKNVQCAWPKTIKQLEKKTEEMLASPEPWYVNLTKKKKG